MEINGNIIESAQKRAELVQWTDVLEKAKALVLLAGHDGMTTEQVANYYEVGIEAIKSMIKDHRSELVFDGYTVYQGDALRSLKNLSGWKGRAPKLSFFPRQAILRIGMLLRDSLVAKTVRDYLLHAEQAFITQKAEHSAELENRELRKKIDQLLKVVASEFEPVVMDGVGTIQRKQTQPALTQKKSVDFSYLPKGMTADIALKALSVAGYNFKKRELFDLLIQLRFVDRHGYSYTPTALGQKNGVMPYRYEHKSGYGYTVVFDPETLVSVVDTLR